MNNQNTIVALSTPAGQSGVALIRMSGHRAIDILSKCWKGKNPAAFSSHTVHLGWICDAKGLDIDQVVVAVFLAPNSYTGENTVEITCHGSMWIVNRIIQRLIECGASAATAGEFSRRAFMNGKLDLAQAEGVADMIAASSAAAARLAATQMRGTFSKKLEEMRSKLVDLGTLLELELDFSEEDVEFADRGKLITLTSELLGTVSQLASSYKAGRAFKAGIPVAIVGQPNAGKSTLLNTLTGEEKAIVSEIPGTTRDIIEDTVEIEGILFRFYDTAGLRESEDTVERIGIERARKKLQESYIILHLVDSSADLSPQLSIIDDKEIPEDTRIIRLYTKSDLNKIESTGENSSISKGRNAPKRIIPVSAKTGEGIEDLRRELVSISTSEYNPDEDLIITNSRHYESLKSAEEALQRLLEGLTTGYLSADFLAQDLREASHHIGTITGVVSSTELLQTIFSRYCIGK